MSMPTPPPGFTLLSPQSAPPAGGVPAPPPGFSILADPNALNSPITKAPAQSELPLPVAAALHALHTAQAGVDNLGLTGIENAIPNAVNAGADMLSRIMGEGPAHPMALWATPDATARRALSDAVHGGVGPAVQSALTALTPQNATAQDVLRQSADVGGDVLNLIPGVEGIGALSSGLDSAGDAFNAVADAAARERLAQSTVGQATGQLPSTELDAGLRNAVGHPIARNLADEGGRSALINHNQVVGNRIAANETGVPGVLTPAALDAGAAAPNAVYARVEARLPVTEALSPGAQAQIAQIGANTTFPVDEQTAGAIENLKRGLLEPNQPVEGAAVIRQLRALRRQGYANIGSEDDMAANGVSRGVLGRAQLDAARALETHIAETLTPDSGVSLEQLQQARTALAKSEAVRGALQGSNVNLRAIGRMYQADPELMTGGLRQLGEFAQRNPTVVGNGRLGYEPPSYMGDLLGSRVHGDPTTMLSPRFWSGLLGMNAAARRVLTGALDPALGLANSAFPLRDDSLFSELAPPPPAPAPPPPARLSAPAMVNAGGGATTATTLEQELGLTPDVAAAGAAHPGAPRIAAAPAALEDAQAPRTMETVQPPPFGASGLHNELYPVAQLTQGAPPSAAVQLPDDLAIPFADLLAHGVEQAPAAGLSLAPMGAAQPEGIPFQVSADHLAGDLTAGPEDAWMKNPEAMDDLARVLSANIPDGILARTSAVSPLAERGGLDAGSLGMASPEAIQRVAEERAAGNAPFLVGPDGDAVPLAHTTDAVDRAAPAGHLKVQLDPSDGQLKILDRGGLPLRNARALLARFLTQHPPSPGLGLEF